MNYSRNYSLKLTGICFKMNRINIPDSWKDKLEKKKPCWIVWEFDRVKRETNLRGICSTEENAKVEKMLIDWDNKEWGRQRIVHIEKSRMNHMFGASMYEEYFKGNGGSN